MQTGWQKIGGKWYYFYSGGSLRTGWYQSDRDGDGTKEWFYLTSSGAATGWKKLSNTWYYFDSEAVMLSGLQTIDGAKYYFTSSGAMQTGWLQVGGNWYYFTSSGAYTNKWLKSGGYWYYFDGESVMVANTTMVIGGVSYTFDANGHML